MARRWTLIVMTALAALVVTGCGPGAPAPSDSPSAHAAGGAGGLGTVSTSPAPPTTPTPPTTHSTTPASHHSAPPSYPDDAETYTRQAVDAWVAGDTTRLGQLATSDGVSGFTHIPGHPDTHWGLDNCQGAAGSSYCIYYNADGDMLRVHLSNPDLGHAHAIKDEFFEATTYPSTADAYVNEFMTAWKQGNPNRMKALSSAGVYSYMSHFTPQDTWTLADDGTAGHTHVRITNADGFNETVDVTNQLLNQPHAITQMCNPTCS